MAQSFLGATMYFLLKKIENDCGFLQLPTNFPYEARIRVSMGLPSITSFTVLSVINLIFMIVILVHTSWTEASKISSFEFAAFTSIVCWILKENIVPSQDSPKNPSLQGPHVLEVKSHTNPRTSFWHWHSINGNKICHSRFPVLRQNIQM